jgi:membrane protease YdiL (CAAX protease family)
VSRTFFFLASLVFALGALADGAQRVYGRESTELDARSPLHTLTAWSTAEHATSVSARLLSVDLHRDEHASFEVCTEGTPDDAHLRDRLTFVIWQPATQKLELSVPLNDKFLTQLRRDGQRACLLLGGGNIEHDGTYALDAVWGKHGIPADIEALSLRARVLAKRALGLRDGLDVALLALGVIGACLSFYRAPGTLLPAVSSGTALVVTAGAVLGMGLLFTALLFAPLQGSLGGLARGVLLALAEVGIAFVACHALFADRGGATYAPTSSVAVHLGLHAPGLHPGPFLLAAPVTAALLHPVASYAMALVPSTGEAPLESFIAWPSGALCFALIGMLAPCAEELFFRGFVYGTLRVASPALAFLVTVVLFALAHAQQSFGNWGALLAVTCTGIAMTSLRAVTGSTIVPMVAHVLYNAFLWRSSFRG